jgi:hypothetical protein
MACDTFYLEENSGGTVDRPAQGSLNTTVLAVAGAGAVAGYALMKGRGKK